MPKINDTKLDKIKKNEPDMKKSIAIIHASLSDILPDGSGLDLVLETKRSYPFSRISFTALAPPARKNVPKNTNKKFSSKTCPPSENPAKAVIEFASEILNFVRISISLNFCILLYIFRDFLKSSGIRKNSLFVQVMKHEDRYYIKRALKLACINAGKTSPNPWVGAVVVKEGRIIGEGLHIGAGFPHAEVEAIEDAKRKGISLKGSSIYVSLQPCNTHGRTPPCTEIIKKEGIKKIFFSSYDPNIDQKSYRLKESIGGILKEDGDKILLPYFTFITKKRPYIIIKLAQTLDGKIADTTGKSKYMTSQKSLELVHKLRAHSNAVIIGEKTLLKDNPMLNIRFLEEHKKIKFIKEKIQGEYPNPIKIIIDSDLSSLPQAFRMNIASGNNTVFVCTKQPNFDPPKIKNISFMTLRSSDDGKIELKSLSDFLYRCGVMIALVEGGGMTAWEFIKQDLFDEIWVFISPIILGSGISVGGSNFFNLGNAKKLKIISIKKIGDDVLLRISKDKIWEIF